jgi:hypothetical protein
MKPLAIGEIPLERNPHLSVVIKGGKAYIRTRDEGKVDVSTRKLPNDTSKQQ